MDAVTTPLKFVETFERHGSDLFDRVPLVKFFSNLRERHTQFSFGDFLGEREMSEGILYQKFAHKRLPLVQIDRRGLGRFDNVCEFDEIRVVDGGIVGVQERPQGFL